ncbi:MAG TPA: amidohydrolase family protein [Myxococcales bacterium]|jgi:predicted TIM-barrel fold metal-dependent hydrolase
MCGAVLVLFALAAPSDGLEARSRIVPLIDHHQHLFSPDDALLVNGPPLLPAIALPEDLAALLRARESAWNSPPALEKLFARDSVLLGGQTAGWIAGRSAVVEELSRLFSKPYRMIPVEYAVDGRAARISGYLARSNGDSLRYLGYFSEQLVKDGDAAWKIGSETPVYPFREIQDPIPAAKLIGMLDAAGIRRAVVLSEAFWFDGPFIHVADPYAAVRKENDWTAQEAALFPDRLVAFCSFNPLQDYAVAELTRCANSHRFAGLKLSFAMSGVDMKKPGDVSKVRRVFAAANGHRLPIVVHGRGTENYGAPDVKIFLDQIVSAAPDVVVQVAHLWGGEAFSEDALSAYADAVSAKHPATRNLYFDVAEVTRSAHGSEAILRTVAQRLRQIGLARILYGSDAALNGRLTPAEAWAQFRRQMPLTDAELSAIASNVAPYLRKSP